MASVEATLEQLMAITGVRLESLEMQCRQDHLYCLAEYCDSIGIIGMNLGLSEVQIGDIDKDHRINEEKRVALVKKWMQSFGLNATYKKFIESLLKRGHVENAREVCNLLVDKHETQRAQNSPPVIEQPDKGKDQLVDELTKLETEYRRITCNAARSLDKNATCTPEEMQYYVATLPLRVKMCYEELKTDNTLPTKTKNFTHISEFVGVINDYSDYMNPALLEDTIMMFCDEETKEMMRKYRIALSEFQKSTTVKQFVNAAWKGATLKDYQEIELELESNCMDKTLEDIRPPKRSWLLKRICFGSVKIIFGIPDLEDLKEREVYFFLLKHVKRIKVQNYVLDFQSLSFTFKDMNPVPRESTILVDTEKIKRLFTFLREEITAYRKSNTQQLTSIVGPTTAATVRVKKRGFKVKTKSTKGHYPDMKHRLKHLFQWRGRQAKEFVLTDMTMEMNQRYQSSVLATNFCRSPSEQPEKGVGVANVAFQDGELYTEMGPEERELNEKQTEKTYLSAAAAGGLGKSQEDLYTDMEPGPIELTAVATTVKNEPVIPETTLKIENLKPPVRPPKPSPRPEPTEPPGKKEPAPPPTQAKPTKEKPPPPSPEMYTDMRAGVQEVFINQGTGPEEEYSEMSPVHAVQPEVYDDVESVVRSPQHKPTSAPKPQPKQEEEAPLITPIDDDLYEDTEVAAAEAEKYKRISHSEQPPPPALPSKPVTKKRYSTPLPLAPLQKSTCINSTIQPASSSKPKICDLPNLNTMEADEEEISDSASNESKNNGTASNVSLTNASLTRSLSNLETDPQPSFPLPLNPSKQDKHSCTQIQGSDHDTLTKSSGLSASSTHHTASCDTFEVFLGCYHEMGRVVSQYYRCAELTSRVPFIDPVTVIVCDHKGMQYTLQDHDITLNIPAGAISKGQAVHIEIAVALYGPFTFPNSTRPISPILWICPQDDIEFNLPIQVTLPHLLTDIDPHKLNQLGVSFAKADHNQNSSGSNNDAKFNFQLCSGKAQFHKQNKQGFGCLETKHCCFLCISADQSPEVARKAGFLLSRIDCVSSSDPSTFLANFVVTFFLSSCLKALKMLFPVWIDKHTYQFKFEEKDDEMEAYLYIDVQTDVFKDKYVMGTYPKHRKIQRSEVDFWAKEYNKEVMKLKHDEGLYPPKITMKFKPIDNACSCAIPFMITGCIDHGTLDGDIILPLASSSGSTTFNSLLPATSDMDLKNNSGALTMREHIKIWQYLKPIGERDIILLGQALGLLRPNLKKMKDLPEDMIDAWLRQEDHVIETSGPPTWKSLCKALRKLEQNGIAADIEKNFPYSPTKRT